MRLHSARERHGVNAPASPLACSLCRSLTPRAGCERCELRQPSLFSLPPTEPTAAELALGEADRQAAAAAAAERARRNDRLAMYRELGRAVRVGLVGCAKSKDGSARPARELYASRLFRSSLLYAERTTDETYIVSAFHGLVQPDDILAPYDHALSETGKRARLAWGVRVVDALAARLPGLLPELVILAGHAYAFPIQSYAKVRGWTTDTPLARLAVGERLAWLKRELTRLAPPEPPKARRRKKGEA